MPAEVRAFISRIYPAARIVETESDHNGFEVNNLHNNIAKELEFDLAGKWIKTSWNVSVRALPVAVTSYVSANYN